MEDCGTTRSLRLTRLSAACLGIEYQPADCAELRDGWTFPFHGGKTSRPTSRTPVGCGVQVLRCHLRQQIVEIRALG